LQLELETDLQEVKELNEGLYMENRQMLDSLDKANDRIIELEHYFKQLNHHMMELKYVK